MRIQLDLPDDVQHSLAKRFPDKTDAKKVLAAIAQLAVQEWTDWFAAQDRPKTVSALHQSRVRRIYECAELYAGRPVRRGVLFNQWNIPYGEASYIERVFSEVELPGLIASALTSIHEDLDRQIKDWQASKVKDEDQQFTVEVDKYGQQLLQSLMQAAKDEHLDMAPSERSSAVHGYYSYTFVSEQAIQIRERCASMLKRFANG